MSRRLHVELKLDLRSHGCREPLHDTNTRRKKSPRPAESAAVCPGKLQSKRLGFGADYKADSQLHSLLTHRNLWHAGWRLKRAFRFRKFFGYFLPKKVTTRKTHTNTCMNDLGVPPALNSKRGSPPYGLRCSLRCLAEQRSALAPVKRRHPPGG
jgi:hypothetical protein